MTSPPAHPAQINQEIDKMTLTNPKLKTKKNSTDIETMRHCDIATIY